jgi:two-component system OmpR family sensor kinase
VIDRGIGISAADRAHIFERFFRSGGPPHRPGVGLGLTIVREFVEAHRGRVDVASSPGVGSTFRVDLPVHAIRPDVDADRVPRITEVAS